MWDSGDAIAASLVDVTGDPLFDVRVRFPPRDDVLVRRLYGSRMGLTLELEYEIDLDGSAIPSIPLASKLAERCLRMRSILAVALEALDSVDMNRLPVDW